MSRLLALPALCLLALGSARPTTAGADAAPRLGSVTVEVLGLESGQGTVRIALYRSAKGFPAQARPALTKLLRARKGGLRVRLEGLTAGPFAVSVHHDADADAQMDTNLFGVPAEGYGFSRNAHAPFGPPDFASSRLLLAEGERKRIRIRMRY